jgi:hypothetical protein
MHLVIKKKNNNEENPKKNTCDIFTTNFSLSLFLKYNFVSSSSIYYTHHQKENRYKHTDRDFILTP